MFRKKTMDFPVDRFGAIGDGLTNCTAAIQAALDAAAEAGGGRVVFWEGVYMSGAIYIPSNVELHIAEGAVLQAIVDDDAYPLIWTRVAGIEMHWPSALINVLDQQNVAVSGKGIVDGQGEYWWDRYWGQDKLGGMRKDYTARGLRWAVDYDCRRPRLLLASNCSDVRIADLTFVRSPFWNVHICYSDQVVVSGLRIVRSGGPSTDGIDIDSSSNVLVEHCDIDCNDDNICVKAGRDADGLRVGRPSEHIRIQHCKLGRGAGVTLGSETSGGIRYVHISDIEMTGTENGFRLKSARTRGGVIEHITVRNITMTDVLRPFSFLLNWHPSYSYASIPDDFEGEVPEHWRVMAEPVLPPERGIPEFRDIDISDITANSRFAAEDGRRSKAFEVEAYEEKAIRDIRFARIELSVNEPGFIAHAADWTMEQAVIRLTEPAELRTDNCRNVQLPTIEVIES
ncbi:glycoside hydrolase family 28 protein [Paenibacillus chartarius]|uniref:Glycoside hydrolase family 28 protein n=1 Tax=Paenibacillus chartarius TaxID=747481 RepID=A0ABV6DSK9_9BACL